MASLHGSATYNNIFSENGSAADKHKWCRLKTGSQCRSWVQDKLKRLQAVVRTLAESVSLTLTDTRPGTKPPSLHLR